MSGGWGAKVDHVFGKLMDIYTHKRGNSTVFTETGQIAHIPKSLVNPIFYYIYIFLAESIFCRICRNWQQPTLCYPLFVRAYK